MILKQRLNKIYKKLPKIEIKDNQVELIKSICSLLIENNHKEFIEALKVKYCLEANKELLNENQKEEYQRIIIRVKEIILENMEN
ncbi:hypothetical protein [Bacillus sp. AFS017336]|uniref:hypothetical protein n=1 Tax=Bacillus sp. AFS017336 TaxID=2033489 RepID=UPI000BEFCBB8|nr:hypothetical protein [Bacillus sp. AFS017336]PEK99497.1 hypothetical protein CN601_23800 [Bacillus sp. AFS017336]